MVFKSVTGLTEFSPVLKVLKHFNVSKWTEPLFETKPKFNTCHRLQNTGPIIAVRERVMVAGEAEAGSAGEQPVKEYPAGDSSRR